MLHDSEAELADQTSKDIVEGFGLLIRNAMRAQHVMFSAGVDHEEHVRGNAARRLAALKEMRANFEELMFNEPPFDPR